MSGEWSVRPATEADLPAIMGIYEKARGFMRRSGNRNQWINGYPSRELVLEDIRSEQCYVCLGGGDVHAVFCYFVGDEPTYHEIDGAWQNDAPYGVVHRIGSDGAVPGIGQFCLDWCFDRCGNLRIDTHRDNAPMRHVLEKQGFSYCGVIIIDDGSERVAYQKCTRPD